jgi:hypothetical protein
LKTQLTLWALSLPDVKQRIRPLFTQERVAASAGQFLDGLLGNEPRKTGWMRGSAGKITNCQIGVFAAYVSRHGHALHRPGTLPANGMDGRTRSPEGSACRAMWALRRSPRSRVE